MTVNVHLRAVILFSGIVLACLSAAAGAADIQNPPENRVTAVNWQQTADAFLVTVHSEEPLTYTAYELVNPLRIVLDIADATLAESAGLPAKVSQGPVSEITGQVVDEQEPFITRLELILSEDRAYIVERADNSIVVKFAGTPIQATIDKKKKIRTSPPSAKSTDKAPASFIEEVVVTPQAGKTSVLLQASGPIQGHKRAQLPKGSGLPDRLYIDIPDVRMKDNAKQIKVGTALARIRMAHRGSGLRVVFDSGLDHLFEYEIETTSKGLLITITDPPPGAAARPAGRTPASTKPVLAAQRAAGEEKITPHISAAAAKQPSQPAEISREGVPAAAPAAEASQQPAAAVADSLAFAGYNNQKITVDFFKIDLHNVFRLIGEISGSNIVVDEGVSGTLTLALTEVPWDFVLDVVLNLKDLQKEERYNTIVISPKSKEFHWPKRATDKLAIKADGATIGQQDALTIKKRMETSPGIIEATKLVHQGNEKYRAGDYHAALPLYEDAFAKWPENKELAGRIAAMALVHLGMNAKAVHYAKAVLTLDPRSTEAALHAAIGLANMKKTGEAKKYFDMAISSDYPSSEALLSYAAFCEENESYEAALNLLHRHEQVHGDTMESMVAKARVYDKQGRTEEATGEYRQVLLSGFDIPADLRRYINGRIELTSR